MRGKPLVDDRKRGVEASFEECKNRRVARRRREASQVSIRPEKSAHLLIVENDPAQCFEPLVFALWLEFAEARREVGQADRRLAELPFPVREHRNLAHFIDLRAVFGRARFNLVEVVDENRTPVGADQVQHQRDAIGISGLGEAVELVFRHRHGPVSQERSSSTATAVSLLAQSHAPRKPSGGGAPAQRKSCRKLVSRSSAPMSNLSTVRCG